MKPIDQISIRFHIVKENKMWHLKNENHFYLFKIVDEQQTNKTGKINFSYVYDKKPAITECLSRYKSPPKIETKE